MGQANRRGPYEKRKAAAIAAGRKVAIVVPETIPETVPVAPQGTQADPFIYTPNRSMAMAGIMMAAMAASRKNRWRLK